MSDSTEPANDASAAEPTQQPAAPAEERAGSPADAEEPAADESPSPPSPPEAADEPDGTSGGSADHHGDNDLNPDGSMLHWDAPVPVWNFPEEPEVNGWVAAYVPQSKCAVYGVQVPDPATRSC